MPDKKTKSSLERQIDENLRKVYQQAVQEEVPDRFKDLLSRLKEQDNQQ